MGKHLATGDKYRLTARVMEGLSYAEAGRELLQVLGYDWHPALSGGRVNNVVSPDNGKPKLFIKFDSPAVALTTPKDVADAYQTAQTEGVFTQ